MPKSNIIKALEELDKKDIYSLILFVLYRLKEKPEYSTLSELVFILDNESFINFLNYYGGTTITVPTVKEFKDIVDALMYYERAINTDMREDEIFKDLNIDIKRKPEILKVVNIIINLIEEYDFKRK